MELFEIYLIFNDAGSNGFINIQKCVTVLIHLEHFDVTCKVLPKL